MCIVPIQDYLGLDNQSRVNVPSTNDGNWSWRLTADKLTKELQKEILGTTRRFGRFNWENDYLLK